MMHDPMMHDPMMMWSTMAEDQVASHFPMDPSMMAHDDMMNMASTMMHDTGMMGSPDMVSTMMHDPMMGSHDMASTMMHDPMMGSHDMASTMMTVDMNMHMSNTDMMGST